MARGSIVIAGSVAQKPRHGGHTWVFLQYLLGFRRLGWDVLFLDRLDPAASADAAGRACPTCGLDWITTPQPIVLEHWPVARDEGTAFTTVASWRGAYGPVEYRGEVYGLRVHEFRRFADLPRRTGREFRLALDMHPA